MFSVRFLVLNDSSVAFSGSLSFWKVKRRPCLGHLPSLCWWKKASPHQHAATTMLPPPCFTVRMVFFSAEKCKLYWHDIMLNLASAGHPGFQSKNSQFKEMFSYLFVFSPSKKFKTQGYGIYSVASTVETFWPFLKINVYFNFSIIFHISIMECLQREYYSRFGSFAHRKWILWLRVKI